MNKYDTADLLELLDLDVLIKENEDSVKEKNRS